MSKMTPDSDPVWMELFTRQLTAETTRRLEESLSNDPENAEIHVSLAWSRFAVDREVHLIWLLDNRPGISFVPGRLSPAMMFWRFQRTPQARLESGWARALKVHGPTSGVVENMAGALLRTSPIMVEDALRAAREAGSTGELRWLTAEAEFRERRLTYCQTSETQEEVRVHARKALGAQAHVLMKCDELERYANLRHIAFSTGEPLHLRIVRATERLHAKNEPLAWRRAVVDGLLLLLQDDVTAAIDALRSALHDESVLIEVKVLAGFLAEMGNELQIRTILNQTKLTDAERKEFLSPLGPRDP